MLHFLLTKISKRMKIRITNEKKCLNCKGKLDLSSFRFKAMFSQLILPIQNKKKNPPKLFSIALRKLNIEYCSILAETISYFIVKTL